MHLSKASSSIIVTLSGSVIFDKLVQSPNAYLPMLVIPDGIVTDFSPSQPANAHSPILVIPWGIEVKLTQDWNMPSPMKVTLSGIFISDRLLQE